MPRKPNPPAPPQELAPINEEAVIAAQRAGAADLERTKEIVELAQQMGRMQGMNFIATVADRSFLEIYQKAKKSKAWVHIPVVGPDGKFATSQNFDEFCRLFFGKSYRRCEELLTNSRLLGDLYEQAEALGLGQRDYNALKALPADDQAVIRQAIEGGADHQTVVEQLVTLTERQVAQKRALQDELEEAKHQMAAKDEVAATAAQRIERLTADLAKAKRQRAKATPDETLATLRQRLTEVLVDLEATICGQGDVSTLDRWTAEIIEHARAHDLDVLPWLAGIFAQVERTLWMVRDAHGVPHIGVGDPAIEARATMGEIG